jgi:hypothetical protein
MDQSETRTCDISVQNENSLLAPNVPSSLRRASSLEGFDMPKSQDRYDKLGESGQYRMRNYDFIFFLFVLLLASIDPDIDIFLV